ncbi:MAG: NAD(P)H-dependent oxidoreductase, partial [Clostridia bacterium]|nr:NAD(P)H-dependent oxidoreductase [Clostridia bacterium]
MNILVINGSPKGENSVTLQTIRYLEKRYPHVRFEVLNAGARIKGLEKDMKPALDAIERSQIIIFSYPVYTFIAPSQLHRFIELLKEHNIDLSGKYATQLTTSKHFYDVTAHRYIEDNCYDLGLRYIRGLSADMDDLLSEKGRREARDFLDYVLWCVKNGCCEAAPAPLPTPAHKPVTVPQSAGSKPGDVVIITDLSGESGQLESMIERFRAVFPLS